MEATCGTIFVLQHQPCINQAQHLCKPSSQSTMSTLSSEYEHGMQVADNTPPPKAAMQSLQVYSTPGISMHAKNRSSTQRPHSS